MRPSGLLAVGLCMTLFLGLFAFSAPSNTSRADPMRHVDYPLHARAHAYDSLEVESPEQQSAPPALVHTRELSNVTGERGHFVSSTKVGPNSTTGFHFYSPIARQAGFDVNKSHFLYQGADNESVFLSYEYLNTLGIKDIIGRRPRNVSVTHIIGDDPQEWTTTADTWGAVRYRDLWAGGIDLRYVAMNGEGLVNGFKSDFILTEPTADPADIAVEVSGAESLEVSADGQELRIVTALGNVTQEVFMYDMDTQLPVSGNFTAVGSVFGFEVDPEASWDKLVIDPLIYSTFLGGTATDEQGWDIYLDQDTGEVYATGHTAANDWPNTTGTYQTTTGGAKDAFIVKLSANGSELIYSTYIGGDGDEYSRSITVDENGSAYIVGWTVSTNFPQVTAGFQSLPYDSDGDCFALKLGPNGTWMEWSTRFGGNDREIANVIILDSTEEHLYIAGSTESQDFPTTAGSHRQAADGSTAEIFVMRVMSNGSAIVDCTYLGGDDNNNDETIMDIVLGTEGLMEGYLYVVGTTGVADFPTSLTGHNRTWPGGWGMFVGAFTWNLDDWFVSTFVGDCGSGQWTSIAMSGTDVVTATSTSKDVWPTTVGTYLEANPSSPGAAVVVTVYDRYVENLVYGSFFVSGDAKDLYVDQDDHIYVCGKTDGTVNITNDWSYQSVYGGGDSDAFLFKTNANLTTPSYGTFFGGNTTDWAQGLAIWDSDDPWDRHYFLVGTTDSIDLPTSTGAFQEAKSGGYDVFVAGILADDPTPLIRYIVHPETMEIYQNWTLYAEISALTDITEAYMVYNSTTYAMTNISTYNWTVSIRTANPGSRSFTIRAYAMGNVTETSAQSFSVGNIPQFSHFRGESEIETVVAWQLSCKVTDELTGDSGLASVHLDVEGDDEGWIAMDSIGSDRYESPIFVFEEEATLYWRVRAIDNVGNVAYSPRTTLQVGAEAGVASTSSTLTVEVEDEPWVPTPVSSASWWIYVAVFAVLILGFALTAAPRVANGELIMTLLVAAGASAMVMAYLSAVVGVLDPTTMAIIWLGLLAWAWATSRGGPTGLLLGGAVLLGGLAVQAILAGAILEWLTWTYILGAAGSTTGALSIQTGNAYLIAATAILEIIALVFGIIFVFV